MECVECHADVDKLYWHESTGPEKKTCLSCLAKYVWELRVGDRLEIVTDDFYVIENEEINTYIASLDKLADLDSHTKLYRQRNSNNVVVVKDSEENDYLECLDVTVELLSA
jgi:hypothetical protein